MALLQVTGQTPTGASQPLPISGDVFTFKGTIANGSNQTTDWFDTASYPSLSTLFVSDRTGFYTIEYSNDKVTLFVPLITVQYDGTDVNTLRKGAFDPNAKWCRIVYYNNSGSTANLSMRVVQRAGDTQASLETLGGIGAVTRLAQWVKGVIHPPDANGAYGDVQRTGNSLNVNVTNQSAATDVSTLAKENGGNLATIVTRLTTGNQSLANIDADLGASTDTAVIDPTQSGSVIALLKGILSEIQAPASSGTVVALNIAAGAVQTIAANPNRKQVVISSSNGTLLIGCGFTPNANSWVYRVITNGTVEIPALLSTLSINIYAAGASTGTAVLAV